ncbi:uncharacterized protein LOC124656506 [Lolium rigidum]|uniref:uncharacterized protein LOC124656506 n=1 Tax=Lolium rigidum TaxID=89674 RepID=UPI001F5C2C8A|nr:uncharacterized protein LOC124656506 [Lolium rigidum]
MVGGRVFLHLWNEWAVQILVLFSFTSEAFLFAVAGNRRRSGSTKLKVLLWLAYLLADSTATYTLGHLSIASAPHVHQLVAFWAPFLLLHLGGQDTITAYALEDNRLWLRHLQTLVVQVLGAAYVLYMHLSGSGALVAAAILMFAAGALKYGERIWALKCADNDGLNSYLKKYCDDRKFPPRIRRGVRTSKLSFDDAKDDLESFATEEEMALHGAHTLLSLCVRAFINHPQSATDYICGSVFYFVHHSKENIYAVIEMELSLMYDIMYTKARVVHTWYGLCIRVVSLLAIATTAVLVFCLVNLKDGYKRVDVAITCILLVGALLLEVTSGFIAFGSTWTGYFLYSRRWNLLHPVTASLRRLVVRAGIRQRWSETVRTVGQFNMLDFCTGDSYNLKKVPMRRAKISPQLKDLLLNELLRIADRHDGAEEGMYSLNQNTDLPVFEAEFDTRIVRWQIATDVILCSIDQDDQGDYQVAIKNLSDYMMFLLVKHPDMLPGHSRGHMYVDALQWIARCNKNVERLDKEASIMRNYKKPSITRGAQVAQYMTEKCHRPDDDSGENATCNHGVDIAKTLLQKGWDTRHLLGAIFGVWVEMLCYAGRHCSRDCHARKLSSGGEFLTVVWLLTAHLGIYEYAKFREPPRVYHNTHDLLRIDPLTVNLS